MNKTAYNEAVDELKEVAAGRRGWVSITAKAKSADVPKRQMEIIAECLRLTVKRAHGRHGTVAVRA